MYPCYHPVVNFPEVQQRDIIVDGLSLKVMGAGVLSVF